MSCLGWCFWAAEPDSAAVATLEDLAPEMVWSLVTWVMNLEDRMRLAEVNRSFARFLNSVRFRNQRCVALLHGIHHAVNERAAFRLYEVHARAATRSDSAASPAPNFADAEGRVNVAEAEGRINVEALVMAGIMCFEAWGTVRDRRRSARFMRRALSLEASNVAAPRDFVYFDDALEAFDAARYHLALLHHKGCAEAGAVDERAVLEAVVSRGRVTKIHQMAAAGLAYVLAQQGDVVGGIRMLEVIPESCALPEVTFRLGLLNASLIDDGDDSAARGLVAARHLARALESGHAAAGYELGQLYESGHGVPHNLTFAFALYETVSRHGGSSAATARLAELRAMAEENDGALAVGAVLDIAREMVAALEHSIREAHAVGEVPGRVAALGSRGEVVASIGGIAMGYLARGTPDLV